MTTLDRYVAKHLYRHLDEHADKSPDDCAYCEPDYLGELCPGGMDWQQCGASDCRCVIETTFAQLAAETVRNREPASDTATVKPSPKPRRAKRKVKS